VLKVLLKASSISLSAISLFKGIFKNALTVASSILLLPDTLISFTVSASAICGRVKIIANIQKNAVFSDDFLTLIEKIFTY
jgi:hypothetical protein